MDQGPIIDIGDQTIDISKVYRVGPVQGDSSWLTYKVYFDGGLFIEIYEERKYDHKGTLPQMKREAFVKLWRSFVSVANPDQD